MRKLQLLAVCMMTVFSVACFSAAEATGAETVTLEETETNESRMDSELYQLSGLTPGKQSFKDCGPYSAAVMAIPYVARTAGYNEYYSPTFINNEYSRGIKDGISGYNLFNFIENRGVVNTLIFPVDSVTVLPEVSMQVNGLVNRVGVRHIAEETSNTVPSDEWFDILSEIKRTIREDARPVIVGFYHDNDFRYYVNRPVNEVYENTKVNGSGLRHIINIIGYKDKSTIPGGGYFKVANSWGGNWGNNGYAYITYSYMARNMYFATAITSFRKETPKAYAFIEIETAKRGNIGWSIFVDGKEIRPYYPCIAVDDSRPHYKSVWNLSDAFDGKTKNVEIKFRRLSAGLPAMTLKKAGIVIGEKTFSLLPTSNDQTGKKDASIVVVSGDMSETVLKATISSDAYTIGKVVVPEIKTGEGYYNYSHTEPEEGDPLEAVGCNAGSNSIWAILLAVPGLLVWLRKDKTI